MIGRILGLGNAARQVGEVVGDVAEVFVGNRAERDAAELERFNRSLAQFGEEFGKAGSGRFDGFVNGLNRLPRPLMAVGTLGLFAYSMLDPHGFATRMQGLAYVPEPLWWLLGAVVSFYFGARELHYYRGRRLDLPAPPPGPVPQAMPHQARADASTRPVTQRLQTARPTGDPSGPVPHPAPAEQPVLRPVSATVADPGLDPGFNAAFEEWRAGRA